MKRYKTSGVLRLVSIIVLCFFTWSFGGVVDIAYAIQSSDKMQDASYKSKNQNTTTNQSNKTNQPEGKFQKTMEDIEQILVDPATDNDTKKGKLKTKKTEIEACDTDIKKQFADTEKKLKDSGMPSEILERHYSFVKHYDDNLKELRNNLEAIDKAKDKAETEAAIEKTRKHLEKVKPPKKHTPLDPNKLPHRTAEPVFKEPRMNPEQFEKEQGAKGIAQEQIPLNPPLLKGDSKSHNFSQSLKDALQFPTLAKGGKGGFSNNPVLLASNGSLSGLLTQNSELSPRRVARGDPTPNLLVAQATNVPSDADLAQTIEVQFTPEIKAKAQELGYNPLKIYEWVRNNIEYVPTYGSIQGANMCLQTKQCNDFDAASLLIALLRASGVHARYVYGTIELPIEKAMNWVGGFTDANAALNLIASGKIPVGYIQSGGRITTVRMEHTWVEAWIDYFPSRGARHKAGQGDTWIPLDASFKQYNYTQGIDIKTAVPFNAQAFIEQIQTTATINET